MTELTIWDHLFSLGVFVLFPLYSRHTFPAVVEDIRQRGEPAKIASYKQVILIWAAFAICTILIWTTNGRPIALLGAKGMEFLPAVLATGVAIAVIAMVVLPIRSILHSGNGSAELESQLGEVSLFMPETRPEQKWFRWVSINAGVTEELVYRGYLIWYLTHFLGEWGAAIGAVLLFGLAHAYQGLKQVPGVLLISAVAVGLFVYTRSLIIPVLFHIVLDALQGHYLARIRRESAIEGAGPSQG